MSAEAPRDNPFPGLRSFEPDEDYLFFGRERQIDELVRRLRTHRFLAVVGTSGSGKSSLVRSGLIPALQGGAMARAGSAWRVAVLRPGGDPLGHLARALYAPGVLVAPGGEEEELARACFATNLRASQQGLAECVRQARLPAGVNVLVLVDQFEELFRVRREGRQAEATAFVKLLLAAVHGSDLPIYVALTLRSDFIGNCMELAGLPEEINAGLYLVPRLTRDELRRAIEGPVAVGGGTIAPRLVLRLLNDVGDDPDQLPILQHALMRTWDRWRAGGTAPEPLGPLDLHHYEAIGTLAEALSRHAEEAYGELDARGQEIAAPLWKALTDRGTDGRGIRRPVPLAEVAVLAGAAEAEVAAVVERFRRPGRSFLMPPAGTPLSGDAILDLSHESLMRLWGRLVRWAEDEASSARLYLGVARAAARYAEGTTALWRDPELQLALAWRERERPTTAWARRYEPSFARAMAFLDASREERDRAVEQREARRRQKLRRARQWAALLAGLCLLTTALGVFAWRQSEVAEQLRRSAEAQRQRAEEERATALRAGEAEAKARQEAEKALLLASVKSREAERARAEALRQGQRADELAAQAHVQRPPQPTVAEPAKETGESSSFLSRLKGRYQQLKDKATGDGGANRRPP